MNEPYHPWLVALASRLPRAAGNDAAALLLPDDVLQQALTEVRAFAPAEAETVALHLVGFARALHQRYGAAALAPLLEQLVQLAAVALSDPQRLRDAFGGLSEGAAAVERVLGSAPSRLPLTRDAAAPSLLDVRLGRTSKTPR